MYYLKFNITKEVLEASANCPWTKKGHYFTSEERNYVKSNCAFSKVVQQIIPTASVSSGFIYLNNDSFPSISLTKEMKAFIKLFDSSFPEKRLIIPEQSFTLPISNESMEEILNIISLEEINKILENSDTLSIIEDK